MPKPTTRQDVARVIELFRDGLGERNISRETGHSESTVRRILRGQHKYNQTRLMNGKRAAKDLAIYAK